MDRPAYNLSPRQVLEQYEPALEDFCCQTDGLESTISKAIYENVDTSFQPIAAAVQLMLLPLEFLKPIAPSMYLQYHVAHIWHRVLLQSSHSSLPHSVLAKALTVAGIPAGFYIDEVIESFQAYVQRNDVLIATYLDFVPDCIELTLQPVKEAVFNTMPLQQAQRESDVEKRIKQRESAKEDQEQKRKAAVELELQYMRAEEEYASYLLSATKKLKEQKANERMRAAAETRHMEAEDGASLALSLEYRSLLIKRQQEAEMIQRTKDLVETLVNPIPTFKSKKK